MTAAPSPVRLVFAGGGTGGHFFPAVAIADRVVELMPESSEVKITFVGTRRGIEYRLRDRIGHPLRLINIRGLARSFTLANLLVPFLVVGSLLQTRSLLKTIAPHLVVGTGGYVSWPVLRMAQWLKIPTVLQEQNSYPGIATRKMAPGAERVYLGFEAARNYFSTTAPVMITGNPVRRNLVSADRNEALKHFGLDPERRTIVVLGGSQGARSVNEAILRGLQTGRPGEGYQLLWQTGKLDYASLIDRVGKRSERHFAFAFEDRMDLVYASADLIIARAGAITIAEIEAAGVPSLLIPYPFAAGDHQRHNARAYAGSGLAEVVDPDELDDTDLLGQAVDMLESGRAERMQDEIKKKTAGKTPAVDRIAQDIIRLISSRREAEVDR